MTEQKKKHTIDDFHGKPRGDDPADDWTPEAILAVSKKIIAELGINGEITDK